MRDNHSTLIPAIAEASRSLATTATEASAAIATACAGWQGIVTNTWATGLADVMREFQPTADFVHTLTVVGDPSAPEGARTQSLDLLVDRAGYDRIGAGKRHDARVAVLFVSADESIWDMAVPDVRGLMRTAIGRAVGPKRLDAQEQQTDPLDEQGDVAGLGPSEWFLAAAVDGGDLMALLTPGQKRVFTLRRQGATYAEVAEELGISESTVRVTQRDIKKRLGPASFF